MKNRLLRVNQLIKRELGRMLLREVEFDKKVLATITRVETSPDLLKAKVYISTFPANQSFFILQILNQQIFHLQQKLNKRLKMHPVPKIEFFEEKKTAEAGEIEEILEKLKKTEKEIK
jgi:ribosome-binding factor A